MAQPQSFQPITAALLGPDILVNNAGIARGGPVETLPEEVWDANLDANLKGTFLMSQAAIPVMKRQRSGRIINAASFAAIIPSLGGAAYASSKAGVHSLTRVLAGELGAFGITVNCYAPGMVPTEMNHFAEAAPARQEALLDTLSIRRWQTAQDVANLVCFLASDRAAYITGAMIEVSGGKFATQMPWMAYREER
jgi:3-oxoacyl-[acyl-carrier protein] reductase